jgi:hypothetical protein
MTSCTKSLFLGCDTKALGQSQENQIVIGYDATGLGSNTAVLGNASITTTALRGNVGIGTTAPSSKLHVAETWNNAGTTFCAIKSVITDTNSAAGSDFLELYAGTSTQPLRFDVQKTGQMNIYGAWTDASNYERLSFSAPTAANAIIGTNKGSGGGTARGLELQTDGVTRMIIDSVGAAVFNSSLGAGGLISTGNDLQAGANRALYFGSSAIGNGRIQNSNDGVFGIYGRSSTTPRLQFSGTTSSFPALKRSTTTLQAVLADDSGFTNIQGKLTTDTAYTATVVTATGYITIYDSTGTAYKVPCVAA